MYLDDNGIDIPQDFPIPQGPIVDTTQPDPTAAIVEAYQRTLGRAPDATELASEIENVGKYGAAQLDANLAQRAASNGSGGGAPQTFSFASGGGSSAPQSIQPYQSFAFDASKVGTSDAFKFRFDNAMRAIERSGAAKGTLLSPQTTHALQDRASGLASEEFDAEYGRQANTYGMNFGTHSWNEGNRYNSQRSNRLDDFSMADTDRRFGLDVSQFNRGNFESDRAFDYGRERDTVDDTWRFVDYGYNAARNPR
jgi:hypothetical protein